MSQRAIFWMTLTDSKAQYGSENNILDDTNGLQQLRMDQRAIPGMTLTDSKAQYELESNTLDDTNGQ